MKLHEYYWGKKRSKSEGVRFSCTRYLPRGVKKKDYARLDYFDVWMPVLAPSHELISWAKKRDLDDPRVWNNFRRKYRNEMQKTAPRQVVKALSFLAKKTQISVGCSCSGNRCHRFELVKLLRAAEASKR